LILHDTTGQEEFDSLMKLQYEGSDVILLIFSLASKDTFDSVQNKWIKEINNYAPDVPIILVGHMYLTDQPNVHSRLISKEQGTRLALKIAAGGYVECCATTHNKVDIPFKRACIAVHKGSTREVPKRFFSIGLEDTYTNDVMHLTDRAFTPHDSDSPILDLPSHSPHAPSHAFSKRKASSISRKKAKIDKDYLEKGNKYQHKLYTMGYGKYIPKFQEQEIDDESFGMLTMELLKEMKIPIGPRLKIFKCVSQLHDHPLNNSDLQTDLFHSSEPLDIKNNSNVNSH